MAPSQLKQLKASLRESGVLGPQKSKKVRKSNAKDGAKRLQRNAALETIRERFNPFEAKTPARKEKFEVVSNKPTKMSVGRPGVTRGLGEERRRETLLKEMQSRNKVGGMLDRRFGESDPTMTPEERAAERFARQALRTSRKNAMFNLEEDSEDEIVLTHGGRSLELANKMPRDDFDEDDISASDHDGIDDRPTKRARFDAVMEDGDEDGPETDGMPERRKTKNEVMKEIIAKSKMYKAERQAAKEDDDDLRAELDKGMGEFYEALRGQKAPARQLPSPPQTDSEPTMNPERAAMLAGKSRDAAEKEYEANLRQLKMDARSKPSVRTKTEEEQAAEAAAKLEELERNRLRRMRGETESSDDEHEGDAAHDDGEPNDEDAEIDDAEAFGLAPPQFTPRPQLDVEDEDEFVLDDIIASDSEAEIVSDAEGSSDESDVEIEDDGDDDFINGLVLPKSAETTKSTTVTAPSKTLAYTFPCPQTHKELLEVTKNTNLSDLPTIIQRIRALYHKGLAQENQEKLAAFANVLTQHVAYLADGQITHLEYSVLESLLRHLHSMAKSQPDEVGVAFRQRLKEMANERPLNLLPGDLLLLTGISTIFPTSDHFHTVVTPAMLTIARYLGQSTILSLQELGIGAYVCSLALQYQKFAKRFVPEVVTYIVNALAILAPASLPQKNVKGEYLNVPIRLPAQSLRLKKGSSESTSKLAFDHIRTVNAPSLDAAVLIKAFTTLATQATQIWSAKMACPEFATSFHSALDHLLSPQCKSTLPRDLQKHIKANLSIISAHRTTSLTTRKPLLLHNHRPLAIKSSIPQFIENYNPDRHYDPDRDRAELSKLKAEHKKERKGAMRELRKDANFIAREQLREKKARDEAYDKKFKRLVAEIQGEEGREAKDYEREKRKRKGKF